MQQPMHTSKWRETQDLPSETGQVCTNAGDNGGRSHHAHEQRNAHNSACISGINSSRTTQTNTSDDERSAPGISGRRTRTENPMPGLAKAAVIVFLIVNFLAVASYFTTG